MSFQILPDLGLATSIQRKGIRTHPLIDQIALANTWQGSNRVISATYAGNPDTGLYFYKKAI